MYHILIVDDEHIEREGIKFLIQKYMLDLVVFEAANGEEALEILVAYRIDILLTDIKMPFMDGMELCRHTRVRYPDIKIIIFSAYGEFEYAQKAIQYGIMSYLLKPIDVNDFVRVFNEIIQLCEKDKKLKEHDQLQQKESCLLQLINNEAHETRAIALKAFADVDLSKQRILLLLLDFSNNRFDVHDDPLPAIFSSVFDNKFEYVNLNERQSLFFLFHEQGQLDQEQIHALGNRMKQVIAQQNPEQFTIVMSSPQLTVDQLAEEYRKVEDILAYKFFYQESTVLYTTEGQRHEDLTAAIPPLMNTISWHLEARDWFGVRQGLELFFKTIEGSGQHSAIYIKYMCIEITKQIRMLSGKTSNADLRQDVEAIFGCKSLSELRQAVNAIMDLLDPEAAHQGPEYRKKVIKDILVLIEDNYMSDISLKWIADKVFLTQSYLSCLFSKEMGQTLVKYITLVRMQKAQALLRDTNMTIAEISQRVGFMNDSYFCKIFKNYHGISPAKFRELPS